MAATRLTKLAQISLALSIAWLSLPGDTETLVKLNQGWTEAQTQTWYRLSQGSRLLPQAWLLALEQADNDAPFLDPGHIEKFRYLPDSSASTPGLPVGFAIDQQDDSELSEITRLRWKTSQSNSEPWVGMNCAACHSNDITYQQSRLRIEGAPTLADFSNFIRALNSALTATRDDPQKWQRFAAKVLANSDDTAVNRSMLLSELSKLIDWQAQIEDANNSSLEYGFGRLDAFGHIFNKVLLRNGARKPTYNPSNAPVSYPFLWNIHQQDKVQWNGIVKNGPLIGDLDVGALGRNVGEVTGVFADVTIREYGPAAAGYTSSASLTHLIALEQQLAQLKPPVWPAAFPRIQADKWTAGELLFKRQCQQCHMLLARDDLKTPIAVSMTPLGGDHPIGTDPTMACNAFKNMGATGKFGPQGIFQRGTSKKFFLSHDPARYGATASVADMLTTTVIGSIWYKRDELIGDVKDMLGKNPLFEGASKRPFTLLRRGAAASAATDSQIDAANADCLKQKSDLLAYKGRPLNGIWATPPFLHNGSVPSLYELLLPPHQRVNVFAVGTREFDPERVGFVTNETSAPYRSARAAQENSFVFNVRGPDGVPLAGNSNAGHDYGNASLSEDERWALVEYMKAVGGHRSGNEILP